MKGFRKVKLNDITVNLDKIRIPLSSYERSKLEKKYPYYGAQGIIDYVDNFIFDGEYLLVAEDGENLKSQKNKICNFVSGQFWVNNHAHILQANEENDIKYIYYILNLINFRPYISGSAQPKLTQDNLNKIELTIHDLKNQQKIATVLSTLDSKIELNNRINTELEAMEKTLYDYWFVQFDFPDANGKPYKTSGGKMVYNAALKREIPEGWEVSELRNLVDVVKGNISPSDILPTTPYVGLEHIGRKTIVLSDWTTSDTANSDKTVFKKHDILFGKIRPYFHKVAVALFDGITSTDTIILRPKKSEHFGLALETVFTEKFVNTATSSSTGSKMPRADWNVLQHYKIPVPELPLLQNYQELFDKVLAKIEISVIESRKLTLLRDYLLPILMNGQVTVVNKDNI